MYLVSVYTENNFLSQEFTLGPTAIEFARNQFEAGADIVDVKDLESGKVILTLVY